MVDQFLRLHSGPVTNRPWVVGVPELRYTLRPLDDASGYELYVKVVLPYLERGPGTDGGPQWRLTPECCSRGDECHISVGKWAMRPRGTPASASPERLRWHAGGEGRCLCSQRPVPDSGYIEVEKGERLHVLYVGSEEDEAGWLYVRRRGCWGGVSGGTGGIEEGGSGDCSVPAAARPDVGWVLAQAVGAAPPEWMRDVVCKRVEECLLRSRKELAGRLVVMKLEPEEACSDPYVFVITHFQPDFVSAPGYPSLIGAPTMLRTLAAMFGASTKKLECQPIGCPLKMAGEAYRRFHLSLHGAMAMS